MFDGYAKHQPAFREAPTSAQAPRLPCDVEIDTHDADRTRRLEHELLEAINGMTKELSEVRRNMRMKRR